MDGKESRVEPEKLSRRYLTLSPSALVRLVLGHTGDRGRVRRGGLHRLDQHGARRRPDPLPPGTDLAEPAGQRDGLTATGRASSRRQK